MNTGKHAFTVVYTYVLAALNNKADQPRAGEFALAPMPGARRTRPSASPNSTS